MIVFAVRQSHAAGLSLTLYRVSVCLSVCLSTCLSVCLPVYLSFSLFVSLIQKVLVFCNAIKFGLCSPTFRQCCLLQGGIFVSLPVCLSVCLSVIEPPSRWSEVI